MHVLPLRIHNLWIAINTAHVEQILGEREWSKLPAAPRQWPGVLAWQGRAVAVLDLVWLLNVAPLMASKARRRTLMARACGCLLAIPVDEVHEAQLVGESALGPVQVTRQEFATSELSLQGTVMPLFDPVKLIGEALAERSPG